MGMLRANAAATLLSDPEPDWLTSKGLDRWGRTPIFYVRYETTPPLMREALGNVGAKAIGRRGDDGAPNIDHLISALRHTLPPIADNTDQAGRSAAEVISDTTIERESQNNSHEDGNVLTIALGDHSDAQRQELLEVLLSMDVRQLALTIRLPSDASESDRSRLINLGFSHRGS